MTTTRLFVYGTLKRDCSNHAQLTGQRFVGEARTLPGFALYEIGGYPGMAPCADDRRGVAGEIWLVDAECLRRLDFFEGVHEGLYTREPIALQPPHDAEPVDAYVYRQPVTGREPLGDTWRES